MADQYIIRDLNFVSFSGDSSMSLVFILSVVCC